MKKPLALLFHTLFSCSSVSIVKFEQIKFEKELKKDITSIAEWSNETNFVFNTSRTKICSTCNKQMSVWQKLKDEKFKIYCNGIKLERVSEWELFDIGRTINENLTLSSHISKILENSYLHLSILKNSKDTLHSPYTKS